MTVGNFTEAGSRLRVLSALSNQATSIRISLDLLSQSEWTVENLTARSGGLLFWLMASDELLAESKDGYKNQRSSEPGGCVVSALRVVRNEIAHGTAITISTGVVAPVVAPVIAGGTFVPADQIVLSHSRRGRALKPQTLSNYSKYVAGRAVTDVLTTASHWVLRQINAIQSSEPA